MRKAGIKPVVNTRRVGHGVEDAMSRIRKRAMDHRIGALRLAGHGNLGTWISVALGDPVGALEDHNYAAYDAMKADWPSYIDYAHFVQMKPILAKLAPSFAPFGYVEAHSCCIGKQHRLLQSLADVWGVPVSGGLENQYAGTVQRDRWGNAFVSAFMLTGRVVTAYPGRMNLAQWAARANQLVPNLPGLVEQGRRVIQARLGVR